VLAILGRRLVQQRRPNEPRSPILRRVADWLYSLREADRMTVLHFCREGLFDTEIFGREMLESIVGSIREITTEWRFDPAAASPRAPARSITMSSTM
jgi:hypothetical protein